MAGDWLKIETVTPDKPEIYTIAGRLEIDPDAVFGKLFRVWTWADQHTESGNAPSVSKLIIDRLTGTSGFCDAMVAAGWLIETEGGLEFPNFGRHNGQTAKTRALTAKRVAKHKLETNANGNGSNVSGALPKEEKSREDLRSPLSPPKGGKTGKVRRMTKKQIANQRGGDIIETATTGQF